jgi:hypothetical protein
MSNLTILYATDDMTSRLNASRITQDWDIICPTSINEALGLAVYYAPHAVVIDGDSDWLNELVLNLINVTGPSARMKDIVVRLADEPLDLDVPDYIDYHELPVNIAPDVLAQTLARLDAGRIVQRHYELTSGAA